MASSPFYIQWTHLSDEDLTVDKIHECLKPIQDDLWVAAACADRLVSDPAVQRTLLELGLKRTENVIERCKGAVSLSVHSNSPINEDNQDTSNTEAMRPIDSLAAHFRETPMDAQLCRVRIVLLDRLDRLYTFVEIWKNGTGTKDNVDGNDVDEWEDDPWADGGATESSTCDEVTVSEEPPLSLREFLVDSLLDIAFSLASLQQFRALHILMARHGSLWPYRFAILENIPEYAHPSEYRDLLPAFDVSLDTEQAPPYKPWRAEPDWTEANELQTTINASDFHLASSLEICADDIDRYPEPLGSALLKTWYEARVDTIISCTGMVDVALAMIQHGASQGIPGLDELGEELSLLSRLVYDAHSLSTTDVEDWTLGRWSTMDASAVVRAYLAHSTPDTLTRDIQKLVMPYLFVLESRAERAGCPDPELPNRLLYKYILAAPLEMAAAVFEASKPTLPPAQRLIRNDEDIARLALACLYGSESLDQWGTMSRLFECLPAWDIPRDNEDEDEAETTITSLGAFVTPSTTRPRCTASDLLLFFNPLPLDSLSRALDILDVHLESGEIFARWHVPAPLRWFLQSSNDPSEQRKWANRMARRAGGHGETLETQDEWNWLLEDMLRLSGTGESGLKGAFGLLDKKEILRIFLEGLLSSGQFGIAKSLLHSPRELSLDAECIEDICLSSSREFYDNASSGNYKFGDMKLAYECLDVPSPSDRLSREKEFIEATSRLSSFNVMSRPGIPISPIEIRLTKNRLSLVSRVLSSNIDAYKHTEVILDLVYKLGFRNDTVAEVKTLAMLADTALQVEDFSRAYETSERMVAAVLNLRSSVPLGVEDPRVIDASEVCWIACFQLGRQSEFDDVQKRLSLLGHALELCPPDKLYDILAAWRPLEKEYIGECRERLAISRSGNTAATKYPRRQGPSAAINGASSLSARLQDFHMPSSPLVNAPDAAAFANRAFNRVASNFPFSVGNRGRSIVSGDVERSRSGSRRRLDAEEVSAQASRVLQKGIGWLIGADDE